VERGELGRRQRTLSLIRIPIVHDMRKLVLRNFQSPGDIVMLTGAVRDLHRAHPGEFATDVRTSAPALWLHNPYLTTLDEADPDVETLDCHYPLIHQSNTVPAHFLHAFPAYLNQVLGTRIRVTDFRGDIHLSDQERSWTATVAAESPDATAYWLIASGGKFDYTIKWWSVDRYQQVVDHFRGRIQFVQVGEAGHHHPPLRGAVDLRGRTDLRQLVLLVHRAQGIVSPVSLLMHLAAAVEMPEGAERSRPCVVVAGGREPPHFSAYPTHQFIHTVGALRCCATGGCWKSRTLPLGDGDPKDAPDQLCVDVVDRLPRCMDMITADEVIRRIELYFAGGHVDYVGARSPLCMVEQRHGERQATHT
jgi:ADP-heptose:LPS heptosyltransferase